MSRLRYLLVAATASFALAGCGEKTLDVSQIEEQITPEVESQTGAKDVQVDCPDDVEAEKGGTFECDLSAQGGIEASVNVTQEDDEGNVSWELVRP